MCMTPWGLRSCLWDLNGLGESTLHLDLYQPNLVTMWKDYWKKNLLQSNELDNLIKNKPSDEEWKYFVVEKPCKKKY